MAGKRACLFMADYGSDPTESAVPWQYLTERGVEVDVATEHGGMPEADRRMYKGLFSLLAGADRPAKAAYAKLIASLSERKPLSWSDKAFHPLAYDLLVIPGGHDVRIHPARLLVLSYRAQKGVRQMYESASLQRHVVDFMPHTRGSGSNKVAASICHGPLLLAFAKDADGKSVLHDRKVTGLPEAFEQKAHNLTRLIFGDYYRTCVSDILACVCVLTVFPATRTPFAHGRSPKRARRPSNSTQGRPTQA
jgi:putative intracellular protease/amidase